MKPFVDKASDLMEDVEKRWDKMMETFKIVLAMFGEESSEKVKQEDFLGVFRDFLLSYEVSHITNAFVNSSVDTIAWCLCI
jgi:hypothetical protein